MAKKKHHAPEPEPESAPVEHTPWVVENSETNDDAGKPIVPEFQPMPPAPEGLAAAVMEETEKYAGIPPVARGACPVCGHGWDGVVCRVDGYRGEP